MRLQRVSENGYVRPARGPRRLGQGSLWAHPGAQDARTGRGGGALVASGESGDESIFFYLFFFYWLEVSGELHCPFSLAPFNFYFQRWISVCKKPRKSPNRLAGVLQELRGSLNGRFMKWLARWAVTLESWHAHVPRGHVCACVGICIACLCKHVYRAGCSGVPLSPAFPDSQGREISWTVLEMLSLKEQTLDHFIKLNKSCPSWEIKWEKYALSSKELTVRHIYDTYIYICKMLNTFVDLRASPRRLNLRVSLEPLFSHYSEIGLFTYFCWQKSSAFPYFRRAPGKFWIQKFCWQNHLIRNCSLNYLLKESISEYL